MDREHRGFRNRNGARFLRPVFGAVVALAVALAAESPAWAMQGGASTKPPSPTAPQDPATLWRELREAPWAPAPDLRTGLPPANVGAGPLLLRPQSPFQSLRLGIGAVVPGTLGRGEWEFRETMDWSRMWAESDDYLLNFDTWGTTHSILYGMTDRLQLEIGVAEHGWSRGRIDGFVRDFHDLFGIDQGGRDTRPLGEFAFRFRPSGRTSPVDLELERDSATESLAFALHQVLTDGTGALPAIGTSVTLKTDLDDGYGLQGSPIDVSWSLSFAKKLGDFFGYVVIGVAWNGCENFHGLEFRPLTASAIAAVEWNVSDDVSVIFQWHWGQGAVRRFGPFSEPTNEIILGTKIRIGEHSVFEVGLVENILVFDNTPDVGFHSGLAVRF